VQAQVRARAREEAVQGLWWQWHLQAQPCQVHLQAVQRRGQRRDLHSQPVCWLPCSVSALAQVKAHEQSHLTDLAPAGTNTTAQNVVAIEAVSVCTTGGELAVKNVGVEAYVSTKDSAASARNAKVRALPGGYCAGARE
jgi:hypothetical protein